MYQRIRDLREDRDLLQKDVAAYLKCTQVSTIPVPIIFLALRTIAPRPSPAKRKTAPKVARIKSRYFGGSLFDIKIFHYGPAWKGSCKRVHTASSMQE